MVWYGSKWENRQRIGLIWPPWPLKTKFFHRLKFYVILSLWLKFGTILLAGSRENCSQGHKLNWRLLAFEGSFSKNIFRFPHDFTLAFKIFTEKFCHRQKGVFTPNLVSLFLFIVGFICWYEIPREAYSQISSRDPLYPRKALTALLFTAHSGSQSRNFPQRTLFRHTHRNPTAPISGNRPRPKAP